MGSALLADGRAHAAAAHSNPEQELVSGTWPGRSTRGEFIGLLQF